MADDTPIEQMVPQEQEQGGEADGGTSDATADDESTSTLVDALDTQDSGESGDAQDAEAIPGDDSPEEEPAADATPEHAEADDVPRDGQVDQAPVALTDADYALAQQWGVPYSVARQLGPTGVRNLVGSLIGKFSPASMQGKSGQAAPAEQPGFELELGEEYDDGLKANLVGMHDYAKRELADIRAQFAQLAQIVNAQQQRAIEADFDAGIRALPEGLQAQLGANGEARQEHQQNRQALRDRIGVIRAGLHALGHAPLPMAELVRQAAGEVLGTVTKPNNTEAQTAARKELVDKLKKQERQLAVRPSRRTAQGDNAEAEILSDLSQLYT